MKKNTQYTEKTVSSFKNLFLIIENSYVVDWAEKILIELKIFFFKLRKLRNMNDEYCMNQNGSLYPRSIKLIWTNFFLQNIMKVVVSACKWNQKKGLFWGCQFFDCTVGNFLHYIDIFSHVYTTSRKLCP